MKKIVTLLSAALVLLASAPAFAQASFGAGFLSSVETYKSGSTTSEKTPLNGFYAGVGYTVPVASGINFTPGVYLGYVAKNNVSSGKWASASHKQQDMYINIPLHFSFGTELGSGLRFFAYAGPSASISVTSKITNSGSVAGIGGTSSYDRYQEYSDLQRFDIMLGAGVGLQLNDMLRFQVGYDFGMLNRWKNSNDIVRRNQLTAGVAFLF